MRSRVVTGPARSRRGRGAAEEGRLARARPQSRGDGFIPSGGRALRGSLREDRFRAGPPPRAPAVNRVAPSALRPRGCRGARPAALGVTEARPRLGAVAAGTRPLPAAPARPRRRRRPAASVFVLMEPACSWRVSGHVPWAGGGWGAGRGGRRDAAVPGPGGRGGLRGKGRGGVCPDRAGSCRASGRGGGSAVGRMRTWVSIPSSSSQQPSGLRGQPAR